MVHKIELGHADYMTLYNGARTFVVMSADSDVDKGHNVVVSSGAQSLPIVRTIVDIYRHTDGTLFVSLK